MDTFWEFCYGVRNMLRPENPEKTIPKSQSPISRRADSPVHSYYHCAHMCCVQTTLDVSTWNHVKIKERVYYLCSQHCWDEWLNNPDSWSPMRAFDTVKEPPPLVLE